MKRMIIVEVEPKGNGQHSALASREQQNNQVDVHPQVFLSEEKVRAVKRERL